MRLSSRVPRPHLALFSLMLAVLSHAPSTEAAPGGKPVLQSGDACLKTSKGCDAIKAGATFATNEEIQVGEHGAIVKLGDGVLLDLAPGTALRIQMTMPIPLGAGEPVKAQTMTLVAGKLQVDASPRGKTRRAILLRGPRKSQLIVSGGAAISLKDETLSAVNLGGKMLATTASDWNEIPVGKAFSLSKTEPKPQLRDTLPAPAITGGRWVTTSLSEASEGLSVTWDAVPRAGAYELRLSTAAGAVVKRTTLPPRETSLTFPGLAPGAYELRLAVVDEGGLDGAPVPPIHLAVLEVGLPPGGFRSGPSSVQVAEGQSLALAHGKGVELAYDKGTSYTPIGKEFVMRGDQARLLRFRIAGASLDGVLRVEPRSLAALVDLTPKDARWPRDTLSATIRLVNKSGGSIPPDVKMIPKVTLGVTPISVTFEEDGPGALKARIPAQPGPLPAALRIEVHDQHGIYLGRGFLEIAKLSPMSGEWHVEMLWRCTSCSERNLGRHTLCQRCGQPKTGKEDYEMPGDTSASAAISDPALLHLATAGANWRCRFCGSDQRRFDGVCGHCGADQAQGTDLGALPAEGPGSAGQAQGAPPGPGMHSPQPGWTSPRPPSMKERLASLNRGPQGWLLVPFLGVLLLGFIGFCLVVFRGASRSGSTATARYGPTVKDTVPPALTYRDVQARLAGASWEHTVQVERYKILPGEGFAEARPADALAVKKSGQRVHHTDRVPDGFSTESYTETVSDGYTTERYSSRESCGQTCTSRPQTCSNKCTSGKNGFAKCSQVCTGGGQSCTTKYCDVTKTRQVPRTRKVTKTRQVPRFKNVPVMRDWYTWSAWGWTQERAAKASGSDPETRWPTDAEVALNKGVGKGEKERATRHGTYTIQLTDMEGATHRVSPTSLEDFRRHLGASTFLLRIESGRARVLEIQGAPASSATSVAAPTSSR